MEAVPKQYPALIRARKVAKKARKDGYEFGSDCEITEKIKNQLIDYLSNVLHLNKCNSNYLINRMIDDKI